MQGENGFVPFLLSPVGNSCHTSSVSSHRCTVTTIVALVSIRPLHLPCLCLSCLYAKWHSTPVFHLGHCWVSKPHISEIPAVWAQTDPLGEGLPACGQYQLIPEHCCMTTWLFRVYGNSQHTAGTSDCCPQLVFVPMFVGGTSQWCSQCPLPTASPHVSLEILRLPTAGVQLCYSTRAWFSSPGMNLLML